MTAAGVHRDGAGRPPVRVGVVGASGRMGTQTCAAVEAAPDLELVARLGRGDDLSVLTGAGAQVVVDFTRPEVVVDTVCWCLRHGIDVVTGTSGLVGAALDPIRAVLDEHPDRGVVVAANFAIGAVLTARFARQAARWFESVEIIELHHAGKIDAPSFTATLTAQGVAAARAAAGLGDVPDATSVDPHGARGAVVDGVHVHAVRLPGLVAHQEVLLGSAGERLTIRHDSVDRGSFMPGVLTAVRAVTGRPGLTVGLDDLLGMG